MRFFPILILLFSACSFPQNSEQIVAKQQEMLNKQAVQSVGMPAIVNFAEKRHMKDILELRDKDTATFTYIVGMNNQLTFLCNSIGYGLPYATQYTNPEQIATYYDHYRDFTMPQADPNGLYMPGSAEATWVLCMYPGEKLSPVYVEPKIMVSPYPLSLQ